MTDTPGLFKGRPEPIDWAEQLAREIVEDAYQISDATISIAKTVDAWLGTNTRNSKKLRGNLAFCVATALAPTLRQLKAGMQKQALSRVEDRVNTSAQKLYKEISSAGWIAEFLRDKASELDGAGWNGAANTLRDAASILQDGA